MTDTIKHRPSLFLPANLKELHRLASDSETARYAMTGVRLISTERGYRCEATDGKVLAVVSGDALPAFGHAALDAAPNSGTDAIIPTKDWKAAFGKIAKGRNVQDRHKVVGFVLSKDVATWGTMEATGTTSPIEGRYPNVDAIYPREQAALQAGFDIADVLRITNAIAGFTSDESRRVEYSFQVYQHGVSDKLAVKVDYQCVSVKASAMSAGWEDAAPVVARAVLNPTYFADLLYVAGQFSDTASLSVYLNRYSEGNRTGIPLLVETGSEVYRQSFRGLIMPLT